MYIGVEQLIFLTELLIAEYIFVFHQKRRLHFLPRFLLTILICYGFAVLWPVRWDSWIIVFKYFLLFLSTLFSLQFCFCLKTLDTLYCGIAGFIIQHGAYSVICIFAAIDYQLNFSFPLLFIVYGTIFLAEYFLLARHIKDEYTLQKNYKSLIVISSCVIGTTVFLNSSRSLFSNQQDPALNIIVSIYSLICCLLALSLQLGLFEKSRLQNELDIFKQLWHNDQKQFEASKQNVEMLNLYCHDLKHLIHIIETGGAQDSFRKEVSQALSLFDASITTNNHALDVILTEKSLYCRQNQITLTCMADGKALEFIQTSDLYSVFGNLINNSIEAVMKFSNPEKRVIALIVSRKNNFIYIHIENYFTGSLNFVYGLPQTDKRDANYHGFGLKSVKLMVEKYHGNLSIETTEDIFYVNIMIPIPY